MKELENHQKACNKLAKAFVDKYFGDVDPEYWWVGDKIGGVLFINDLWFDMDEIVVAMERGATFKQLSDWHEYRNGCAALGHPKRFNFYAWVKTAQGYQEGK